MTVIRKNNTVASSADHPLEFVLSDGSIDAYDDIVDPNGWDLDDFARNPICLLGHNPDFPIGTWTNVRVEGGKLRGHLKLAPAGTSSRIDEIRKLLEAGILRAVSVGFHPIESEPRPGSKRGGRKYLKQRLVEISVVSTPANSNALLLQARGMGVSAATIRAVFRQSTDASLAERQEHARAARARAMELQARTAAMLAKSAKDKASLARAKATLQRAREAGYKPPAERAAEKQRLLRELAVPPAVSWPGYDPEPLLKFDGKLIHKRKGPFGW